MKKFIAVIMMVVLLLSFSVISFADAADVDVPVEVYEQMMEDLPEGYHISNVAYVPLDGNFDKYEVVYNSDVQTAATVVTGQKVIYIRHNGNIVASYRLYGTFSVPFDGTAATCTEVTYVLLYLASSPEPNTSYGIRRESITYYGDAGRLTVRFSTYVNGELDETASDYGSIACDPYGEVY